MNFRPDRMKRSRLILKEGSTFDGFSPHWQEGFFYGEVVFNTGMTGYCESLTDPSYAGQILAFTHPLIGNYGVPDKKYWESHKIHARGVIVSESCSRWSHHSGYRSLFEWLRDEKIPLITGIDTRQLVMTLRSYGPMPGVIASSESTPYSFQEMASEYFVSEVSTPTRHIYSSKQPSKKKVILVDCGVKTSILQALQTLALDIHQVRYDTDWSEEPFDGVILSNGPGDPLQCQETIAIVRKAMGQKKPIFGICLGAQLLALAAGAKTYKLPFGHRGHNQPCIEKGTERCYMTSQNHGYAIDAESLPSNWEVNFTNMNDGSVEGICHSYLPFSAVQFHPEASPGPTDTRWFFNQFYNNLCND